MLRQKECVATQSGFTLIEVLISIAIFSIGILGVAKLNYVNINGTTNGNVITQEVMLAQTIMERLKSSVDPSSLTGGSDNGIDNLGQSGGGYNTSWSVSNPMGGVGSRFITVTVTRVGGVGGHPVVLKSLTKGSGI